jgi:hypothetical protein
VVFITYILITIRNHITRIPLLSSIFYIYSNASAQVDLCDSNKDHLIKRAQDILFSSALISALTVSNACSDAIGNCTNAASEVWRNLAKEAK